MFIPKLIESTEVDFPLHLQQKQGTNQTEEKYKK